MRLLTDTGIVETDDASLDLSKRIYYWTLNYEYGADEYTDYVLNPMIFTDNFTDYRVEVTFDGHSVMLPAQWQVLCSDRYTGDVEFIPLEAVNNRPFTAFGMSMVNMFRAHYPDMRIRNVFSETKWIVPQLSKNQALAVPINLKDPASPCIFVCHQDHDIPEILDVDSIFSLACEEIRPPTLNS